MNGTNERNEKYLDQVGFRLAVTVVVAIGALVLLELAQALVEPLHLLPPVNVLDLSVARTKYANQVTSINSITCSYKWGVITMFVC